MRAKPGKLALLPVALMTAVTFATTAFVAQAADWAPKKPVEFVIFSPIGIPVTEIGRLWQARGNRFFSFRNEPLSRNAIWPVPGAVRTRWPA